MSTNEQFNRIVGLVAEVTKQERQGSESVALGTLAERFGTTRKQIEADIRTLTMLGDDPDADWLLSLNVWQEGAEVSISSGGPYQRPLRLTAEELMAIQLGLADVGDEATSLGSGLAQVLQTSAPVKHAVAGRGRVMPSVSTLFREAIGNRNKVEIKYAGERTLGGINRVIHPYQLLEQQGHTYVVAWCELADGWRHFRADRIIDALLSDHHYTPRSDFHPAGDSFSPPAEGVTPVEVRFSPAIARWLREGHPEAVSQSDGSVVVTYLVASPEWLVRHVLQYGSEAEVMAPASFREMMRQQVG